jgi:polyisoprenyl-phosphate glycosyltransferase
MGSCAEKNNRGLSLVIPIYNEAGNLPVLIERLAAVMTLLDIDYEIVFVNDGSTDISYEVMADRAEENENIKIIDFSRNFGHQVAISAGLMYASGARVMILDGDLQDRPESIPLLLDKMDEGYEVVYAVRTGRKESAPLKLAYFLFYRVLDFLAEVPSPLDAGDFCVLDRRVVDVLNRMPEQNRFVRGLRSMAGFRQTGVIVERAKRGSGKPKYSLAELSKLAIDGLLAYPNRLIRVIAMFGMIVSLFNGLLLFAKTVGAAFSSPEDLFYLVSDSISFGLIPFLLFLLFFIGGEYIWRILDEVRGRPMFVVNRLINLEPTQANTDSNNH